MDICPFCGCDPFHRVDNGVGMEAVAVTCCDNGDLFFRGHRPAPETVTLTWEEFTNIGSKLIERRHLLEAAELLEDAEIARQDCEECEGEGEPEACGACFPSFDDARIKRRLAIEMATGKYPGTEQAERS